jgi:hypothetical protein
MPIRPIPAVQALNIAQVFSGDATYFVPNYQRQYAWEEEHINALTEDLLGFANSDDDYYILGQIITSPATNTGNPAEKLAVVDGQQRLTSVYLLLLALREQFQSFGVAEGAQGDESRAISVIRDALIRRNLVSGSEEQRFCATSQADSWVQKLINYEPLPELESNTSQLNVKVNFQILQRWVKTSLDTKEKLVTFTNRLFYDVFLVNAKLHTQEQALEIFEKLNSRGKALNSAELLKNLLFMNVSQDKYQNVSDNWDVAAEEVYKVKPHRAASMEYLMQGLLQPKKGVFVPNKDVYKTWSKMLEDGSVGEATNFSLEIVKSAKTLALVGSDRINSYNERLSGARTFGVVQHLPVALVATRFFESQPEIYEKLIDFLDARIILSLFAEEGANRLNDSMWGYSKVVGDLNLNSTADDVFHSFGFTEEDFLRHVASMKPRFLEMRYTNARDKKRIRFALATISNYVEALADNLGPDTSIQSLMKTKSRLSPTNGYDLDHIFARALAESSDFDSSHGKEWVNGIGNLTLIHSKDNLTAQAAKPNLKSRDYASSKLLLTKSLATTADLTHLNVRLASTLAQIRSLGGKNVENWGFATANAQGEFYFELFTETLRKKLGL